MRTHLSSVLVLFSILTACAHTPSDPRGNLDEFPGFGNYQFGDDQGNLLPGQKLVKKGKTDMVLTVNPSHEFYGIKISALMLLYFEKHLVGIGLIAEGPEGVKLQKEVVRKYGQGFRESPASQTCLWFGNKVGLRLIVNDKITVALFGSLELAKAATAESSVSI